MERDFTLSIYKTFCKSILENAFIPIGVGKYISCNDNQSKFAIIRHDVDNKPQNSLRMATLESQMGIYSTYYFRTVKNVFDESIIKKISDLGHEIGYHYEVLSITEGNQKEAIKIFKRDLENFRSIVPISTICMHGSPLSNYNNLDLWQNYDFSKFGIIGEAFLSLDYNRIYYYTDTGRGWDNQNYNVRDHVKTSLVNKKITSTNNFIESLKEFNSSICINTHPQRWTDNIIEWSSELLLQNIKNIGKRLFLKGMRN